MGRADLRAELRSEYGYRGSHPTFERQPRLLRRRWCATPVISRGIGQPNRPPKGTTG